jgi:hypothetical protein
MTCYMTQQGASGFGLFGSLAGVLPSKSCKH